MIAGILAWLGLRPRASTDRIRDPKGIVAAAFYRKTQRPFRRRKAWVQLADQARGVVGSRSSSWKAAAAHLERCVIRESL